jgi:hypothetical protein
MVNAPTIQSIAANLSTSQRVLLFCVASRTDRVSAGVANATVEFLIELGLIEHDHTGTHRLTERGRAVLNVLLLPTANEQDGG